LYFFDERNPGKVLRASQTRHVCGQVKRRAQCDVIKVKIKGWSYMKLTLCDPWNTLRFQPSILIHKTARGLKIVACPRATKDIADASFIWRNLTTDQIANQS